MSSNVMLCYPLSTDRLKKWNSSVLCQPKLDGIRCHAEWTDNGYILLSRNDIPIMSCPHVVDDLNKFWSSDKTEWDGELYNHDISFEEICSKVNRTVNMIDTSNITYHIFDYISDELQFERTKRLSQLVDTEHIKIVPSQMYNKMDDLMVYFNLMLYRKYEGMIVRHISAPYQRKRATTIMKFKPKKSDAYKIIGWQQEVSKDRLPKELLGALICESDNGNFSVGSGITHDERKEWWQKRYELVGKYLVVGYQHSTSKGLPRFPVVKYIVGGASDEDILQ